MITEKGNVNVHIFITNLTGNSDNWCYTKVSKGNKPKDKKLTP